MHRLESLDLDAGNWSVFSKKRDNVAGVYMYPCFKNWGTWVGNSISPFLLPPFPAGLCCKPTRVDPLIRVDFQVLFFVNDLFLLFNLSSCELSSSGSCHVRD